MRKRLDRDHEQGLAGLPASLLGDGGIEHRDSFVGGLASAPSRPLSARGRGPLGAPPISPRLCRRGLGNWPARGHLGVLRPDWACERDDPGWMPSHRIRGNSAETVLGRLSAPEVQTRLRSSCLTGPPSGRLEAPENKVTTPKTNSRAALRRESTANSDVGTLGASKRFLRLPQAGESLLTSPGWSGSLGNRPAGKQR